jgi:CRP-like cAMP-binding protein
MQKSRRSSAARRRIDSEWYSPRQNRLLAALPSVEYEGLLPHLKAVALLAGSTVHSAGESETDAFFIASGIVTMSYLLENGETAEFAMVGNEGLIGTALFLDAASSRIQAVVTSPGHAYRLPGDVLRSEFEHNSMFQHALLQYTQMLFAQVAQTAVCNQHHSLEQRLCRWILLCLDRLPSNELSMTQELIAEMLGVRREGVTAAVGSLQKAGLINCGRGRIRVLDRPQLEARVCECYAAVREEYARVLPPAEGTTALEGRFPRRVWG